MNSITVERKRLPDVIRLLVFLGVSCVAFTLQVNRYDWTGGILLFAAIWGCGHAVSRMLNGEPRLVVNNVGIFSSSWSLGFVEWSEFEDAIIQTGSRGIDFLCLAHRDPDKLAKRVEGVRGKLHLVLARESGVADLWINATELKVDPNELLRIAREGIREGRTRFTSQEASGTSKTSFRSRNHRFGHRR